MLPELSYQGVAASPTGDDLAQLALIQLRDVVGPTIDNESTAIPLIDNTLTNLMAVMTMLDMLACEAIPLDVHALEAAMGARGRSVYHDLASFLTEHAGKFVYRDHPIDAMRFKDRVLPQIAAFAVYLREISGGDHRYGQIPPLIEHYAGRSGEVGNTPQVYRMVFEMIARWGMKRKCFQCGEMLRVLSSCLLHCFR